MYFCGQNGSFLSFWHCEINFRRELQGVWMQHGAFPPLTLTPPKSGFASESQNRPSDWLWPEAREAPRYEQTVHGFRVRKLICQIGGPLKSTYIAVVPKPEFSSVLSGPFPPTPFPSFSPLFPLQALFTPLFTSPFIPPC